MPQRVIELTELQQAQRELAAAKSMFREAIDPDAVDQAIAQIDAAEKRLKELFRTGRPAA